MADTTVVVDVADLLLRQNQFRAEIYGQIAGLEERVAALKGRLDKKAPRLIAEGGLDQLRLVNRKQNEEIAELVAEKNQLAIAVHHAATQCAQWCKEYFPSVAPEMKTTEHWLRVFEESAKRELAPEPVPEVPCGCGSSKSHAKLPA